MLKRLLGGVLRAVLGAVLAICVIGVGAAGLTSWALARGVATVLAGPMLARFPLALTLLALIMFAWLRLPLSLAALLLAGLLLVAITVLIAIVVLRTVCHL